MKITGSQWFALALVIAIGFALAVLGTTPQPALSDDRAASRFSAERAMAHVRAIGSEPHPTGSTANAEVRAYLVEELRRLGADVRETQGAVPDVALDRFGRWSGERPDALTLTNVIGVLPGKQGGGGDDAILLMAHHDTVYGSPGAADDSAGIAAIMETVRAIVAQGGVERDIVVLFTDGEELGLLGARQFIDRNPLSDRVGAVVNLEARGGGGRTTLFQTSRDNGEAVTLYADAVGRPGGSSLATYIYEILPNDTDLTPLLTRDYVAYNLSFIGRAEQYHSPSSVPDVLDRGALQDMGDQTLALATALANVSALPVASQSRTFFDVFGLFVVDYGTLAGWALLIGTIAVHAYYLRLTRSEGWMSGLIGSAIVIFAGGLALYCVNQLSGAGAGPAIYYDRLAALPRLEMQALAICIASLVVSAPLWAGRSFSIIGITAAIALQIVAPTTSFIAVWPMLLGGTAGVIGKSSNTAIAFAIRIVLAAMVIGFLLQFGHQFMQGAGTDLPMVTALLSALAIPALAAVTPKTPIRRVAPIALIALVIALALALWVRLDPVSDTVPVYPSMKG